MKYLDIKQALYLSDEMAEIPDGWNVSVPFLCKIDKNTYDAFACTQEGENVYLKQLLLVDSMTGKVDAMDAQEVAETFGLESLSCPAEPIEDYDQYLADKERYEALYEENHSDLIRDIPIDQASAQELINLLGKTVGKIVLNKIIGKCIDEFLALLSKAKQELFKEEKKEQPIREEHKELIENAVPVKE